MDALRGVIERITFHSEETGYTVAKLTPELNSRDLFGQSDQVTLVGNMASINIGEFVELRGEWKLHPEYGRQFVVEHMHTVLPATIAGIEKYLGSGMIKGVGPVTARRIVACFGEDTLDVIEQAPERLTEVPGVGRKRVQMIRKAWAEQRAIKEVMLFLQSNGVSTSLATKIYKYYGDDAIGIVQSDPYRLAQDIYGIGFLTADRIARSLGIPVDSPQRVAAGVAYALNQAADNGHVFLPSSQLLQNAAQLLDVTPQQAATGITQLWDQDFVKVTETPGGDGLPPATQRTGVVPQLVAEHGQLYAESTVDRAAALLETSRPVYLTPMYYSEQGAGNQVLRILRDDASRLSSFFRSYDWQVSFDSVERASGIRLAPEQRQAVQIALTRRVAVITGGPGTGKTTTVRTVLQLCRQAGHRVMLAAPTGRAAKRLAETTGYAAKTIHRMLEFQPGEGFAFKRDAQNPLEADLLIVDEASMLDTVLTNHLLKAVAPGTHLLLVGDVDQLPSVGPGNVLADLIAAIDAIAQPDRAAVVRLREIFRQAQGSLIVTNAHLINRGQMPDLSNPSDSDFFVFRTDDPARAAELVVELVQERIPRRFAIPPSDIQVLSPMHRGVAGVAALNNAIQQALNPPRDNRSQRLAGNRVFRVGDRVMQIRNNYDKEVYNGDIGEIAALDLEMQHLTVIMDGRPVRYDFLELDELAHAFAISVHKSQGSEFPAVVIPILTSHYMMLQRNLLYTAVTRARRLAVLVGQPRAIAMAVRNGQVTQRYTGLRECIVAA
ncbi:MAG: ATP-dependent RecD-like DNA helicase [Caldilineaceae bacterium]|jgi:exodeoxyribonuclease V alpha subunit